MTWFHHNMHVWKKQSVKNGENDMQSVEIYIQIRHIFLYSDGTDIHETG